ncbi:MAG: DegT/DnrJ/EryC1/StrS family aminotransferase [Chloroflexota bacterium]|nr:DegT/DnrJ/EryC1/StrS family aminotransferase [Chloroflexota bacterium]
MYQFSENIKSYKSFLLYRGETAIYTSLLAMGIGQGDEVILQSFTCPSVPYPIINSGATPVYVDIDPTTFSLDPNKIEEKISKKTKAIVIQHTFGIPAAIDPILDIARTYNLWVIEDCCHAFGARYKGQEVGTFGDVAIYSFGWYKPLVLGVGGAAVVNNSFLRQKMVALQKATITPSLKETFMMHTQYFAYELLSNPSLFWFQRDIYHKIKNYRQRKARAASQRNKKESPPQENKISQEVQNQGNIPPQNGKINVKGIIPFQKKRLFQKLDQFTGDTIPHQSWIVSQYEKRLSRTHYKPLELDDHLEPVFYKYPLLSDHQEDILKEAPEARIELSNLFVSPIYPPWRRRLWGRLGYQPGTCPISEGISDRIIALPVHAKVQTKQIEKTIAFLTSLQ